MTPAQGSVIGGRYHITRQIGEGAMGSVWAATNNKTNREVAIKLIVRSTEELKLRLQREAQAYGALKHKNIIEIIDVGETPDGDPFLVMPLLSGETLAERLGRQRRLKAPEAAQISRDVARALGAAHRVSIIHRDLKPANIFLHQEAGEDGTVVKVLDFGVSKNLAASDGLETKTGGMVGSPAYMSPEQAVGSRGVDHRSDIWALGVVLFEMLTGVRPFQGDANQILIAIATAEIPLASKYVRHIDAGLVALVSRCLERDLARRIGSAEEFAEQIQRFTAASSPAAALGQSASGLTSPLAAAPQRAEGASAPSFGAEARSPSGAGLEADPATRSPRAVGFGPRPSNAGLESDPATRSPRGTGLAPPPSMPSMGDDTDAATAKLVPQMLGGMMRSSGAQARPQADAPAAQAVQASPNFGTVPINPAVAREAMFASQYGSSPNPEAPPVGAPTSNAASLRSTEKLPLDQAWPAERRPAFNAQDVGQTNQTAELPPPRAAMPSYSNPDASMLTKHGTMRLLPGMLGQFPPPPQEHDAAPAAAPPLAAPYYAPPSSTSSTAPLLQARTFDPALGSGAAMLQQNPRKKGGVLIVLGCVLLGLGLGAVIFWVVQRKEPASPDAAANPGSSVSVQANAISSEAATASAAPTESSPYLAPPSATQEQAPPSPSVSADAQPAPPSSAIAATPTGVGAVRPPPPKGVSAAPKPGGTASLPPWLKPKFKPKGP